MLLALDVGNTNTVLGLYRLDEGSAGSSSVGMDDPDESANRRNGDSRLAAHWRVTTHRTQTSDEYGVLFLNLFNMSGISVDQVKHIMISSVVPPVETTLRRVCEKYFHVQPLFVEPGIKTGVAVLQDNPADLGADRLVNTVAAFERYGGPCIVVDFGTATTFDVISAKGEYIGGAIAPGLGISADALFARAARLGRVDVKKPPKVIGTNTVTHLQSGMYYGYIGLVDGILERMGAELGAPPKVIATGGLARQIAPDSRFIETIDDMLTLDGLRILFERNRTTRPRSRAH